MTAVTPPLIETHPLTTDRWRDFAALMSSRYYVRHCWCMWPRLAHSYKQHTPEQNRRSIKNVVDTAAAPPGVLAYVDGEPAGWCALAPRDEYPQLDRSPATRRVDDTQVWSIVCFYVLRERRGSGLSRLLLEAAVDLARSHGATALEGYPVEGKGDPFHGVASVFRAAGFDEIARRAGHRPIMRKHLRPSRKRAI